MIGDINLIEVKSTGDRYILDRKEVDSIADGSKTLADFTPLTPQQIVEYGLAPKDISEEVFGAGIIETEGAAK